MGEVPPPMPNRGLAGRVMRPLSKFTEDSKHSAQLKPWDKERMKKQREKEIREPGNGGEDSQRGSIVRRRQCCEPKADTADIKPPDLTRRWSLVLGSV